ncbi:MAG: rod shape-determining protein MreD [Acidimicrobiaceae bacterium]|jgi:rod shape-determining protein MreD|nr:rod shape-determining protein MreD [Acidimicrobiaceae bacterium]
MRRVKVPLVLLVMLLLHTGVLSSIHVHEVRPDGMLLVAVLAGLVGGPEAGALTGFAAGLLADLTLQTPFGLSALVLSLIAFGVGMLQTGILRTSWWIPPLTALAGSALGVVMFALLGALVGQTQLLQPSPSHVASIAGIVALMNAVLAVPLAPVVRWAFARSGPDRAYASAR